MADRDHEGRCRDDRNPSTRPRCRETLIAADSAPNVRCCEKCGGVFADIEASRRIVSVLDRTLLEIGFQAGLGKQRKKHEPVAVACPECLIVMQRTPIASAMCEVNEGALAAPQYDSRRPSRAREREADVADRVAVRLADRPHAGPPVAIGITRARLSSMLRRSHAAVRVSVDRRARAAKPRCAQRTIAIAERARRRDVARLTLARTGDTHAGPRNAGRALGAAVALLVAPAPGDPRSARLADDRQRVARVRGGVAERALHADVAHRRRRELVERDAGFAYLRGDQRLAEPLLGLRITDLEPATRAARERPRRRTLPDETRPSTSDETTPVDSSVERSSRCSRTALRLAP